MLVNSAFVFIGKFLGIVILFSPYDKENEFNEVKGF